MSEEEKVKEKAEFAAIFKTRELTPEEKQRAKEKKKRKRSRNRLPVRLRERAFQG